MSSRIQYRDNLFYSVFNETDQFIAIMETDMTIIEVNNSMRNLLGISDQEEISVPYWELSIWEHSNELQNMIMFSIERIFMEEEVKYTTVCKDSEGVLRDIEFSLKPLYDESGEISHIIAMGYDTTQIVETTNLLRRTERELKLFFRYAKNGYLIYHLEEPIDVSAYEDADELAKFVRKNQKLFLYNQAF